MDSASAPARATYDESSRRPGSTSRRAPVFIPPVTSPFPTRRRSSEATRARPLRRRQELRGRPVRRRGPHACRSGRGVRAIFTTAGTLGPVGIRGWLLGELPAPIRVRGDESPIRKYILGCAGHDGFTASSSRTWQPGWSARTRSAWRWRARRRLWRIQHTAARERLEEAGKAFRRIAEAYETFGELANVMATTRFTGKQMQATIDGILPVPEDDKDHRRLLVEREKVTRLYETAVGVKKLRGTAWGAFQAGRSTPTTTGRSGTLAARTPNGPGWRASGWVGARP